MTPLQIFAMMKDKLEICCDPLQQIFAMRKGIVERRCDPHNKLL